LLQVAERAVWVARTVVRLAGLEVIVLQFLANRLVVVQLLKIR
jgi:hypothetical protein